ncbi:MAG: FG-GAP-like repeat-containing protein [Bacteroidales bacterium]|nr:FG-GAP-like repeat-containing protein [Bacteroidales bacterium]
MRINSLYFFAGFIFLFLISTVPPPARGQSFTAVDPGFHKCLDPAAAFADLDLDGDLDVFISGIDESGSPASHMYRNEGGGVFVEVYPSIVGLSSASCSFADMDNDSDADLVLMGNDGNTNISKIYSNDGGFVFTDISAGLPGLAGGSLAWADFDNDAYPDLLISGMNNAGFPVTLLYKNVEGSSFIDAGMTFAGLSDGSLAWNDINNDGKVDFGICGKDSLGQAVTIIYLNTDGDFTQMNAALQSLWGGMMNWGDYNNDGYADLVINGSDNNNLSHTIIYKNNAGQSFTSLPGSFEGISGGSALWGDVNNDGTLDLLVAGRHYVGGTPPPPPDDPFMIIYQNTGNDQFQEQIVELDIPAKNHIALGDFDNDTDLDLLLTGAFVTPISSGKNSLLFRNEATSVNIPANAPANLNCDIIGSDLHFYWDASTANTSPQGGLNYNLRIGTQTGNMDVFSALASLGNGFRRIVAHGNAGADTEVLLRSIDFGEYYASVQAIDHTYAGSEFSSDIFIVFAPTASFILEDSVCKNYFTTISYTGNASPAAQYIWDFDGGIIFSGSGQGPYILSWDNSGTKTVSLTVIENGMSSDPVVHDIIVVDPVASSGNVSGDDNICQATPSSVYSTIAIPGASSYKWTVEPPEAGDFTGTGTQAEIFWDPAFHGNAYIFVQGVNICGTGPNSDALDVMVRPLPEKPGTPDGPSALCQNPFTESYTTTGAQYALSYLWELIPSTAGTISGNGLQAQVNWDDNFTGPAGIIVTAQNTCGAGPASDTLGILIQMPPVADAGDDQVIEYQTATQLEGSASGGSGTWSYYWMPDDLLVDPTSEDPHTIALESSIQFILTVTDELSGCTATDQVIITVTGGPLSVTASADPELVCPGAASQLLALGSGGSGNYSYSWSSDPSGLSSSVANPIVNPEVSTTYFVELADGGDIATDSTGVNVNPLPDDAGPVIGPPNVCKGAENILFRIDPVANATHYEWVLDEGVFGNSDSTSILLSFSGTPPATTALVGVTPMNECGQGEASSINISYTDSPETPAVISGPDSLCTTTDTLSYFIVAEAVTGALDYEWKLFPDEAGNIAGDSLEAVLHWNRNWEGEASIIVRALNECGHSAWSEAFIVKAFSCVGIYENATGDAKILLYPNPVSQLLSIKYEISRAQSGLEMDICDIYGRTMEVLKIVQGNGVIILNTSAYLPGIYILRVYNNGQLLAVNRFIVIR